jgi:hypothetical protein
MEEIDGAQVEIRPIIANLWKRLIQAFPAIEQSEEAVNYSGRMLLQ